MHDKDVRVLKSLAVAAGFSNGFVSRINRRNKLSNFLMRAAKEDVAKAVRLAGGMRVTGNHYFCLAAIHFSGR